VAHKYGAQTQTTIAAATTIAAVTAPSLTAAGCVLELTEIWWFTGAFLEALAVETLGPRGIIRVPAAPRFHQITRRPILWASSLTTREGSLLERLTEHCWNPCLRWLLPLPAGLRRPARRRRARRLCRLSRHSLRQAALGRTITHTATASRFTPTPLSVAVHLSLPVLRAPTTFSSSAAAAAAAAVTVTDFAPAAEVAEVE